jgi:hypothetical protein
MVRAPCTLSCYIKGQTLTGSVAKFDQNSCGAFCAKKVRVLRDIVQCLNVFGCHAVEINVHEIGRPVRVGRRPVKNEGDKMSKLISGS